MKKDEDKNNCTSCVANTVCAKIAPARGGIPTNPEDEEEIEEETH